MKREHFKILFLDIDGVCNNQKTRERQGDTKFIGIKPELADRAPGVKHITLTCPVAKCEEKA